MSVPLNASATTAGGLLSSSTFEVPPYQREYSWQLEQVSEFWNDLRAGLGDKPYFLGLLILTDEGLSKSVVDGQQRILTLTLLAAALFHEAKVSGRKALAERIQADFLRSIDYDTDETRPRVTMSDKYDNQTLQGILTNGGESAFGALEETASISERMRAAFGFLRDELRKNLADDPFKRLGAWTDFITNRVYFAVFVHPDSASAYQVFEVINTRGRELTTADLLKNYVISQISKNSQDKRYIQWQHIASHFSPTGSNTFVQYIRHVVTVDGGYILPKDLFSFLAQRTPSTRRPPSAAGLMELLDGNLPLYMQMIDPSVEGPASPEMLMIFAALNALNVISVRPILIAVFSKPDALRGMDYVLRLVVRRIVVGNLGTGNVERRFGETAREVSISGDWRVMQDTLRNLNPSKDEFVDQLGRRSYNKTVLGFLRRSVLDKTITPEMRDVLHFIRPRQSNFWDGLDDDEASYWVTTIGNTFLSTLERRPQAASTWSGFKQTLLPFPGGNEITNQLEEIDVWDSTAVERTGRSLAKKAGSIWYPRE